MPTTAQIDSTLSYFYWRSQGIKSLQSEKFEESINQFKLAKVLDDKPANNDIEFLIDSAYSGYVDATKKRMLRIQSFLLDEVETAIYMLDYDKAQTILTEAAALVVEGNNILRWYAELIFFYTEADKAGKAWSLFEQGRPFANSTPTFRSVDTLGYLKDVLDNWIPADTLGKIRYRYYPKMIFVEGGEYKYQKDGRNEKTREYDLPGVDTTVNSFFIGQTEVTVWQIWLWVSSLNISVGELEKSSWGLMGDFPVVFRTVNNHGAIKYANWLSEKTGHSYRLPYEVEWEFAARGGNKSKGYRYSGSNDLDSVSLQWHATKITRPHPVARKKSNELGIFDMSGNVWEWCVPVVEAGQSFNDHNWGRGFIRGGYWENSIYCRVTGRFDYNPNSGSNDEIGFRVCRDPD